jgi:hypothetical protein
MLTGTVGHALLAPYYKTGSYLDTNSVIYDRSIPEKAIVLGERAYRNYRAKHAPDEFGKVIAVEEPISLAEETIPLLGGAYTFQADLVSQVGQRQSGELHVSRNARIRPGLWLVDHKFHKSAWNMKDEAYIRGLQSIGYPWAWWVYTGDKPLGMILNHIIWGGKRLDVKTEVLPYPTERQIAVFINFLQGAVRMQKAMAGWANGSNCIWPRICPFFEKGLCERS